MDIRWNANFVRGLAQSVLERAKVIRNGLVISSGSTETKTKVTVKKAKKAASRRRRPAARRKSGRNV
jgi:hypothetical protein